MTWTTSHDLEAFLDAAGQARVANVHTPPAHRGHGYATALTATVSRSARQAGAREVVLFTDLANPTSNAVYQRIGYRPVLDRVTLRLWRPRHAGRAVPRSLPWPDLESGHGTHPRTGCATRDGGGQETKGAAAR